MGFGTYELTIFQIAKELIDNAMDSIRQLDGTSSNTETAKDIEVVLDVQDPSQDIVRIECTDSGSGISFPLKDAMRAFGTSKIAGSSEHGFGELDEEYKDYDDSPLFDVDQMNEEEDRNASIPQTGKFGVGLSACLLFSSIDNKSSFPLTVCTKTTLSEKINVAQFGISKIKTPVLMDHREEEVSADRAENHGTRITLFARMPGEWRCRLREVDTIEDHEGEEERIFQYNKTLFDGATDKIEDYIDRVRILFKDLRITLRVIDPVRGDRLLIDGDSGGEVAGEEYEATRIAHWANRRLDYTSCIVVGEPHALTLSPDISFSCTAALVCQAASPSADSTGDAVSSRTIPLKLLRYFNSSPVASDQGNGQQPGVGCDVVGAVLAGPKWSAFGCNLDSNTYPPRLLKVPERSLEANPLHMSIRRRNTNPQPAGARDGDADAGEPVMIRQVLLLLDTLGDLPYANMQKCGLTFDGILGARRAVAKVVSGSIQNLRRKIVESSATPPPSPFLAPKKEYHEYILHRTTIPSIATSLARLLHSSALGRDQLQEIQGQLGVGAGALDAPIDVTKFRLETLLRQSLQGDIEEHKETALGTTASFDIEEDAFMDDDSNNDEEWI